MKTNETFKFRRRIWNYFTELDFYHDRLILGDSDNSTIWTVFIYLLSSLGIFCRQITEFPKVKINFANVQVNVFVASFIFGLVLLPHFIRSINSVYPKPGLVQVISAFGIGFLMDFTLHAIIHTYFKH